MYVSKKSLTNAHVKTFVDYFMTTGFKETQAKVYANVPIDISDHTPVMLLLEK